MLTGLPLSRPARYRADGAHTQLSRLTRASRLALAAAVGIFLQSATIMGAYAQSSSPGLNSEGLRAPNANTVQSGDVHAGNGGLPQPPTSYPMDNPSPSVPRTLSGTKSDDITLPVPAMPAAALSTNAADIATQAEQAALQAQAQADAAQMQREQEHNRKSFNRAEAGILPLAPDQIRAFMQRLENTQDAAQPPSSGPPTGQVRITTLSLDPGASPPMVNASSGYVTTINMLDATGQPWPILDVGVGGNFEVSPTQSGTHIVRIMPLTRVAEGNLSILLKDLPTPVIFRLSAGGPTVDLRYDARIPKYGPNAKVPLVSHQKLEAGDETITMLLQNLPPKDAKRMKISGLDARSMAWMIGDHVYVRTPLTLLSPAWDASVSSADGMTVYEIGDAPVLLMSDNGALVRGRLARDSEQ